MPPRVEATDALQGYYRVSTSLLRATTSRARVAASKYVRDTHAEALLDSSQRKHYHESMFHGYDFDFDCIMLRIGTMNMLLHGIESPDIRYRDSLSGGAAADADNYALILARPTRHSRLSRLRSHREGPTAHRQDEEDRATRLAILLSGTIWTPTGTCDAGTRPR
jgi:hypothetical protein